MTQKKLNLVLEKHKKWLTGAEGGEKADLQDADLRNADLQYANLQEANLQRANLGFANLREANLGYANLHEANLQDADLQGANLDFSCYPLWCGGTQFKADDRLIAQVLAHVCSLDVSPKAKAELDKIREFAKTSHRAKDCGLLEDKE